MTRPTAVPRSTGGGDRRDRALCGWSPSPLPADTPTQRLLDRVLLPPATWCAVVVIVTILFSLAPDVPARVALGSDGVAALLAGGLCSANFWRCRHAHCLVTGSGWLALTIVAFAGAAIGRSLIGGWEQIAFLAILAVSLLFEAGWYLARGTNAIRWRTTSCVSPDRSRRDF